jgi:hypothetical protein
MKTTQLTFVKLGLASVALFLLSFVWNNNTGGDSVTDNKRPELVKPISFANLNVTLVDTSFVVGNHLVKAYRAVSESAGGNKGITLAYGQFPQPSSVEISLFDTVAYKTITLGLFNNSEPITELLYEGKVVKKHTCTVESGATSVAIDVEGLKVDAIRIASFEAILYWMRLE